MGDLHLLLLTVLPASNGVGRTSYLLLMHLSLFVFLLRVRHVPCVQHSPVHRASLDHAVFIPHIANSYRLRRTAELQKRGSLISASCKWLTWSASCWL